MKTFRTQILLSGRLGTPLIGDTLFGHVAWGIARREGEPALQSFLASVKKEAAFVISSAFPEGHIPVPILAPHEKTTSNVEEYNKIKKRKKVRYIPFDLFSAPCKINGDTIIKASETQKYAEYKRQVLHNSVDRFGSGTLDEVGLFKGTEYWYSSDLTNKHRQAKMDVYIASGFDAARIKTILGYAFESGYGARASTGAGNIRLLSLSEVDMPKSGKRAMALGPFVPSKNNTPENLRADIFVRLGKLGYELGSKMNPFKKPLLMYAEGSSFDKPGNASIIGSLVEGIHGDRRIVHQAMAPIICFDEE